jgi:MFS family permease
VPYAVLACATMFCWVIGLRAYFYTVMPSIAAGMALSTGAAGALIATMSLGYCAALWLVGYLPGRRKHRVLVGAALSLVCTVGIALAPSTAAIFVAAFVAGLGIGCYLPLGISIIADASAPGRRARNMGVHELMATVGYLSGSAYVAFALPALDWRQATLAWTAVGLVATLAFAFLRDEAAGNRPRAVGTPLRLDGTLGACVAIFATNQMLLTGMIAVLPLIMVNAWGVGQAEAAAVVSSSRLAGPVGIAIAGAFGDRWGPARVVAALFALAVATTGAMAALPYGPGFIAAVFGVNVAASGAIVLISVVVAQVYPGRERERALGVTAGVAGIIGLAVLPTAFGYLVERGLTTAPFVVAALAALASIYLVESLRRRQAGARAMG